jgi:hypothetical protein
MVSPAAVVEPRRWPPSGTIVRGLSGWSTAPPPEPFHRNPTPPPERDDVSVSAGPIMKRKSTGELVKY